jgi:hypothetical protein
MSNIDFIGEIVRKLGGDAARFCFVGFNSPRGAPSLHERRSKSVDNSPRALFCPVSHPTVSAIVWNSRRPGSQSEHLRLFFRDPMRFVVIRLHFNH